MSRLFLHSDLTGISFGAQALLFRKEALERMRGFAAMMLMEDVELSLRLKEVGRLVFFREGIVVSDRRWQAPITVLPCCNGYDYFQRQNSHCIIIDNNGGTFFS